jgi:membrane-bound metal-dependent hydrolase YbcI (DUF457 family)
LPTPISHAAVGYALGAWTRPQRSGWRVVIVAAIGAALPDIDVLGWPLHVSAASLFSHRAITHSLAFALAATLAATVLCFREREWDGSRVRIALLLGLALLSHSCLDGLTTYSVGIEYLAPFSQQRYRLLWTPLGDPSRGLAAQLIQDFTLVCLPALVAGWLGMKARGRTPS